MIKLENISDERQKEWTQIQDSTEIGEGFVTRQPTVAETSMNENGSYFPLPLANPQTNSYHLLSLGDITTDSITF